MVNHIPSQDLSSTEPFAFTSNDLAKLHGPKGLSVLRKMDGIEGVVEGLKTDANNGLFPLEGTSQRTFSHGDVPQGSSRRPTFQDRRRIFGSNRILTKKSKNLFQLMWMVLQDKLLVYVIFFNSYER